MLRHMKVLLGMAVLVFLSEATFAQEVLENIEVRGEIRIRGKAFNAVVERPFLLNARLDRHNALLKHIVSGLAQRLDLDDAVADSVQDVMSEQLKEALEDPKRAREFSQEDITMPLDTLVFNATEDPQGAFSEVLTEEQIQQLRASIIVRRADENDAVTKLLLSWIDQHLSLSPDQRESIHESMRADVREGEKRSWRLFDLMYTNFVDESLHHLRQVKLDGMLTQPQAKVWHLLIRSGRSSTSEQWIGLVDSDDDERQELFEQAQAQIIAVHEAGQMSREEAGEAIELMKLQILGDQSDTSENSKRLSPKERNRQIASAKLAAHTERLGELDERSQKRLTLVSKGVVEQYLEMVGQDQHQERQRIREARMEEAAAEIQGALEAEEITREEADERLRVQARQAHSFEQDSDRSNWANTVQDVTRNPLYQKAIKSVLTEEAFARYQQAQADRLADRHDAMRGIAKEYLAQRLVLNEAQRKAFEEVAKDVSVPMEPHTNAYTPYAYLMNSLNGDDMEGWQKQMHTRMMNETAWARQQQGAVNAAGVVQFEF